jgi:Ca2+ transporting ATPase
LLEKPPVNRTDSMITKRMWANMLGHALYQITVVMVLLFAGPDLLDLEPGHIVQDMGDNSVHYTIIFNSFVWMQLFNEVNCRKLKGECKYMPWRFMVLSSCIPSSHTFISSLQSTSFRVS